jgi:uncharacterized protein YbjT (DUF2867 family)
MDVVIAGGHGQIALRLTHLIADRGDRVRSIIRKEEQSDDVRAAGADPLVADLESAGVDELVAIVGQADAVVFAAGAGPGSGSARKETMDYGGAVKLIEVAEANGIGRYVMVSSVGADAAAKGDDTFQVYLRAKGRADDALIESGLDYTVARPTRLTNELGTGRVRIAPRVGRGSVPRDDVAEVIASCLVEDSSIGKVFEVASGDDPVSEAVARL